jgi:hypothetical protein
MTANLNNVFGLTIQVVDNALNVTPVDISNQGITLAGTATEYIKYLQVPTTGVTLTLPATTIYELYAQNLGSNVVTMYYTPASSTATSIALSPVTSGYGGFFCYAQTTQSGGITAVSLTATSSTTPVVVLMGY